MRRLWRVEIGTARAEGSSTTVAGGAVDVLYALRAKEVVGDGMFTSTRAEDEEAKRSR